MKFCDFISASAIKAGLDSTEKQGVIQEMVDCLVASKQLKAEDREGIIEAILKREELGSTGIGRGIAVPHTKHASVSTPVGAVGISSKGVEFQSLDGEQVQLFFMLISPPNQPTQHLRALENISKQLQDDTFCRFLKQSKTAEDVLQILEEADNNQFVS